ncbi:hypothetical protein D3P08_23220 [Paenibacillus nanensis]|uniref:Uncharacterized protein n=1 Tax=Paenibacillus nanensis TaxID=393251 RepID=A0A3A1UWH9_9BACL|nr:hypothetical protein D3P08_23220 [Paenibacillus nanensis]
MRGVYKKGFYLLVTTVFLCIVLASFGRLGDSLLFIACIVMIAAISRLKKFPDSMKLLLMAGVSLSYLLLFRIL